jgi:hypothetical protein
VGFARRRGGLPRPNSARRWAEAVGHCRDRPPEAKGRFRATFRFLKWETDTGGPRRSQGGGESEDWRRGRSGRI